MMEVERRALKLVECRGTVGIPVESIYKRTRSYSPFSERFQPYFLKYIFFVATLKLPSLLRYVNNDATRRGLHLKRDNKEVERTVSDVFPCSLPSISNTDRLSASLLRKRSIFFKRVTTRR